MPAPVRARIPIEADADEDGMGLHGLLHVAGGFLMELELYRDDGEVICAFPPSGRWTVDSAGGWIR